MGVNPHLLFFCSLILKIISDIYYLSESTKALT
nr:MAG TPA: hypothetical protein [Caudoviricetes sp.]